MRDDQFPHEDCGTHQPELFIHDINFLNWHINHDKWGWFRFFRPPYANRLEDHFNFFDTGHWTITTVEAGQGDATEVITDHVNGVLLITNDAADDDYDEISSPGESFKLLDNYPLYAEIRFKVSDATQSDVVFGLVAGTNYFGGVDDGVYFRKDDGDANIDFCVEDGGTVVAADTGADLANLTWIRLGFHWDGAGTIRWFVITDATYIVDEMGTVTTGFPQDQEMRFTFGIRNGEAVAKVMYVDYVMCVQMLAFE